MLFNLRKNTEKKAEKRPRKDYPEGFVALYAAILVALFLSVGLSIGSIAFKEVRFASFTQNSQYAYYAAESGLECALYWDTQSSVFESGGEIDCGSVENITVANSSSFEFDLPFDSGRLARVGVMKNALSGDTDITIRGYNTTDVNDPRRVERGLFAGYTETVGVVNACNYDIGLALDHSLSLDNDELQDVKEGAIGAIENFQSGGQTVDDGVTMDDETLFTAVTFNMESTEQFSLSDNVPMMISEINGASRAFGTNPASGIVRTRKSLDDGASEAGGGDRTDNKDFLVIITDGVAINCTMSNSNPDADRWCNGGFPRSTDATNNPVDDFRERAQYAKSQGATVIVIGVSDTTCESSDGPDCPVEHLEVEINESIIAGEGGNNNWRYERYDDNATIPAANLGDEGDTFEEYIKENIVSPKANGDPWYYQYSNTGDLKDFLTDDFNCGLLQTGGLENFESYEI